jgi:hypothetical protein
MEGMRSIQSCADMMFVYRSALALFVFFTTALTCWAAAAHIYFFFHHFFFFFPLSSLNNIRFPNSPGNLAPALYFSFCVIPVLSIPENIHNFTLLVFPRVEKEKNPNEKIVAALRLGFCYCPENFN